MERLPQNSNIQWSTTARLYESSRENAGLSAEPGFREFPQTLERILAELARTPVGFAVLTSARLTVSIFPGSANQTLPDLRGPSGEQTIDRYDAMASAGTEGHRAVLLIDLVRAPTPEPSGLPKTHAVSLLHEMVHAVNITWGAYQAWHLYVGESFERLCAPSPEEETAWVVENMHRLAVGLPGRSRYLDGLPLRVGAIPTASNTGIPVHEIERRVADHLRRCAPAFHGALARADVRYNPFRQSRQGQRARQ